MGEKVVTWISKYLAWVFFIMATGNLLSDILLYGTDLWRAGTTTLVKAGLIALLYLLWWEMK